MQFAQASLLTFSTNLLDSVIDNIINNQNSLTHNTQSVSWKRTLLPFLEHPFQISLPFSLEFMSNTDSTDVVREYQMRLNEDLIGFNNSVYTI